MSKFNKKTLIYIALFVLGGCLNNPNLANEASTATSRPSQASLPCTIPENAFNQLPLEVLSGTEVIEAKSFTQDSTALIGHFHAEMGGAQMKLTLTRDLKVQRTYEEPGTPKISKTYTNLCIKSGYLYGQNIRGIFTENGILWLEIESGHEFITSDLWTFLNYTH